VGERADPSHIPTFSHQVLHRSSFKCVTLVTQATGEMAAIWLSIGYRTSQEHTVIASRPYEFRIACSMPFLWGPHKARTVHLCALLCIRTCFRRFLDRFSNSCLLKGSLPPSCRIAIGKRVSQSSRNVKAGSIRIARRAGVVAAVAPITRRSETAILTETRSNG